jgi:hypothetical protein
MRGEVYKIKVDTRDELLGGSLDAASAHINKREDQFSRKARNLCTGVAKCTEVSGGILEHFLSTVTNLSCQRPVKIKLTVSNFFFLWYHSLCSCSRFKQLYLSKHSELYRCSYEDFSHND